MPINFGRENGLLNLEALLHANFSDIFPPKQLFAEDCIQSEPSRRERSLVYGLAYDVGELLLGRVI